MNTDYNCLYETYFSTYDVIFINISLEDRERERKDRRETEQIPNNTLVFS